MPALHERHLCEEFDPFCFRFDTSTHKKPLLDPIQYRHCDWDLPPPKAPDVVWTPNKNPKCLDSLVKQSSSSHAAK